MRIAQVSPLFESVPPTGYGGTERVVSYLTEELVRGGHEVTLFASGDSRTSARLIPAVPRSLRLAGQEEACLPAHFAMFEEVARRAHDFDIVHSHVDFPHFPFLKRMAVPHVATLHGRLDVPWLPIVYDEYRDIKVASISNSQRRPLPQANWVGTVYNGIPEDLYRFRPQPERYLAFLGRMSPEKGAREAIEISGQAGIPLKMAAKVDRVDQDYYRSEIVPLLRRPGVEFLGEVDDRQKNELLGKAMGMLLPLKWPEPFGLVMIEAMACGTPVVVFSAGSAPEVVDHGQTGFVVHDVEQAVRAVGELESLSRSRCRAVFERRFSARRMAGDYRRLYSRVWEGVHAVLA
ncbi:MAG: glycosyltransferase family 4 protein [Armatimonadetes bacterium]|nr:glycosyltransferase family 4 protein [Armatimonadota bacterium]